MHLVKLRKVDGGVLAGQGRKEQLEKRYSLPLPTALTMTNLERAGALRLLFILTKLRVNDALHETC